MQLNVAVTLVTLQSLLRIAFAVWVIGTCQVAGQVQRGTAYPSPWGYDVGCAAGSGWQWCPLGIALSRGPSRMLLVPVGLHLAADV